MGVNRRVGPLGPAAAESPAPLAFLVVVFLDGDVEVAVGVAARALRDQSSLWIAPYYSSRSPRHSAEVLFPLYLAQTWHDSDEVRSSWWLLWPVYQRVEQRDMAGRLLERYRRFGIFSDTLERDGSRVFSVLGIVIAERTPPTIEQP